MEISELVDLTTPWHSFSGWPMFTKKKHPSSGSEIVLSHMLGGVSTTLGQDSGRFTLQNRGAKDANTVPQSPQAGSEP
jgi:hypothetical protein